MKMTQKRRKEIVERTKDWVVKLKLEHWNIDLSWLEEDSEELKEHKGAAAWVDRQLDYGRAYVCINEKAYIQTIEDYGEDRAFKYIIHELVHVILADYDELVYSVWKTEPEYDRVRERTTELLTRILSDLS